VQQGSGESSGARSRSIGPSGSGEGSTEGSGEGLEGFGAEPGQVQQGSGESSGAQVTFNRAIGFRRRFHRRFRRRSGRLRCRARSGSTGFLKRFRRINRVPEKVPEKVWEALVQSQVRFNRVPKRFRRSGPGRLWCKARSGSTGFRRASEGLGLGGFGAKPGQVQQGSEEGSGEGLGLDGFGAEPGQVQQKVPEKVWVWVALVQSQVRTGCRRRSGRLWCRARSSSAGFAAV